MLLANPTTFAVAAGTSELFGVSLSEEPTSDITVSVANTSGNTGLSITSGATITLSSSNWNLPQPVTVAAASGSTGAATFTVSASGCTSVNVTGTETAATTGTTPAHVVNPFTGSDWYVNPDYTSEVDAEAATQSGSLAQEMEVVGNEPTGIWLDHIGAIYGGTADNGRMSLQSELANAVADESGSTPIIVPIVIYDLPDRDCAALASNGELSISNNGLQYYEQDYINPIAQILSDYQNTNIRVVAVIEPDSLPNLVTNESVTNCADADSSGVYVDGIEYALNKLHAIPNVYNYLDIAHSAWLGWPSNMTPAVSLYAQVAQATTDGFASVDGFISNTANYIPTTEPYMTATESVDGNPVDSVLFYSYDPYIEELTYDEQMYSELVSAGFSSNVGMLIDTSRNGWGDPSRPTAACSTTTCTTTTEFVNDSKVDDQPFRGDWCNQENAGIGAFPQANPLSSFPNLYAYVWIKPPGESDGTYPAFSGTGDPHCDPNGTQTDGSGNTYPTNSFPDSPPAGHFFAAEFTQLVQDADPAINP
jgi:cellulose 1,4-beta-cellobiosidase